MDYYLLDKYLKIVGPYLVDCCDPVIVVIGFIDIKLGSSNEFIDVVFQFYKKNFKACEKLVEMCGEEKGFYVLPKVTYVDFMDAQ